MNILVTGSNGFVGRNLVESLKSFRDNKDRTRPELKIEEIYEFDRETDPQLLDEYCEKCDFVFNLAGVNRPENPEDFMNGNFGFASDLLNTLKKYASINGTTVIGYRLLRFFQRTSDANFS